MEKKVLLIANPNSGMQTIKRNLPRLQNILLAEGFNPTILQTQKRGDAAQMAKEFAHEADLVIACGGDGTVNEVISGLLQIKDPPPIGYIPCGTTNDFASTLQLSDDPATALYSIMNGRAKPIDLGSFNGRTFSYVASFGAFTEASYSTSQSAKNNLGYLAYIMEGIKDLPNIRPCHMKIKTNYASYEGDYIFGAFSNSTSIAGIVKLDKTMVSLNDGFLEGFLVPMPKTVTDLNKIIISLTNRIYNNDILTFFHAEKIQIYAEKPLPWTLDGEFEPPTQEIDIEVLHSALNFIF